MDTLDLYVRAYAVFDRSVPTHLKKHYIFKCSTSTAMEYLGQIDRDRNLLVIELLHLFKIFLALASTNTLSTFFMDISVVWMNIIRSPIHVCGLWPMRYMGRLSAEKFTLEKVVSWLIFH